MKSKRQEAILRIISEHDVETQDQLLHELKCCGIPSTQATISRDIKELHLVKELAGNGTYRYAISGHKTALNFAGRLRTIFREGVTSFDYAQNIVVVKTMPGLASAADMIHLTRRLQAEGLTDDDLRKLWGANFLRVLFNK